MSKISVEMFCKSFKSLSKGKDKMLEDFINKHIVTDYVSIVEKDALCTHIVESTCYVKEGDKKFIKFNSVGRYIFFVMKLIDIYTDIEIGTDRLDLQYDELNKVGAIGALMDAIPESEYTEFSTILNMKVDDLRDNEYSITAMLYNTKNSLSLSEEVIASALEEATKEENK